MEFIFMIFGLGFFIFVIWMVEASEERMYQRRLNEVREFKTNVTEPQPSKHAKKE